MGRTKKKNIKKYSSRTFINSRVYQEYKVKNHFTKATCDDGSVNLVHVLYLKQPVKRDL